MHSRVRLVSGTQVMAAGWNFADLQNQLDGIVRNKAINLKVATVMGPFSTLDTFSAAFFHIKRSLLSLLFSKRRAKLPVAQCHKHRHENEIYVS